jgi:large subunit ribosomal protein L15
MPLQRRIPKRGFHNPFRKTYALVNVGQLEVFDAGSEISPELMHGRRLVRTKNKAVKILGEGTLSKPLTVRAHGFSSKAKEKIESVGGRTESLPYA